MSRYSDDIDGVFAAVVVTDAMIDADRKTREEIGEDFPGWMIYRKVLTGTEMFNDELAEWAHLTAHALASARQENGRQYIWRSVAARPGWVTQAGWDALDRAVEGKFPAPLESRSKQFGVDSATFRKVRDAVAGGLIIGMETYRGILHYHYLRSQWRERSGT